MEGPMATKETHHPVKETEQEDWLEEYEGQLAIDAYQTQDNVVIKAPIAGVSSENLEISITDEVVTIKGERKDEEIVSKDGYFCQECYWGAFSRSYILPVAVDANKAEASLKNGILTIVIPKQEKTKTRILKVSTN
jgi:HSP20 family protein